MRVMRLKLLLPSVVVLLLGAAGCGSTASPTRTSRSVPSVAKSVGPVRIYHLALAGAPHGAPTGTGVAVIAFHGSSTVCWRFAHLHGFVNATVAHITTGSEGKSGKIVVALSTGPRLHHQGCVPVGAALVKAIEHRPHGYYVNIRSLRYPAGAVRAQL